MKGAKNEDAVGKKTDGMGDAEAGTGSKGGLHHVITSYSIHYTKLYE